METTTDQARLKQLIFLKMRVELIAWRVQEFGMSPEIRKAIPYSTVDIFGSLLHTMRVPDEGELKYFESAVQQTEEELAKNLSFWKTGQETLH